jgi:hypothetical protein
MIKRRLKDWIEIVARCQARDQRPAGRAAGWQQFRGGFEPLEARTVLSAVVGAPIQVETGPDVSWETVYFEPGHLLEYAPIGTSGSHIETSNRPLAMRGPRNEPSAAEHLDRGPEALALNAGLNQGQLVLVLQITLVPSSAAKPPMANLGGAAPNSNLANDIYSGRGSANAPLQPPKLPSASDNSQPLRATSPYTIPPNDAPSPPHQVNQSTPRPTTLNIGVLSSPYSTTNASSTISATATTARDEAFGEFSDPSLLLAVRQDEWIGSEFDRFEQSSISAVIDETEPTKLADSGLQEDVATSLDALQWEQDAIDAVLSELHEIDVHPDKPDSNAQGSKVKSSAEAQPDSTSAATHRGVASDEAASNACTDGGMVMLVPTGDPNVSAYDLTSLIITDGTIVPAVPLGIEPSVGIYQAFDVGGGGQSAGAREARSGVPPAAAQTASEAKPIPREGESGQPS